MILFVNTETYPLYMQGKYIEKKFILEDISDDLCMVIHYSKCSLDVLDSISPRVIIHSGRGSGYDADTILECASYREAIQGTSVPQLGICGAHQIIAHYYGSTLGPMRELAPDEADNYPESNPGYFKEKGMYPVRIDGKDPLFSSFGSSLRVTESHYWQITELGDELIPLASSKDCPVQAYRHKTKTLYGVQFHPEVFTEAYPDGKILLKNFLDLG